jgi:hypothetical protein
MEIEEKPNVGRETGNHWRKTQQILTLLSAFVDRQIPKEWGKRNRKQLEKDTANTHLPFSFCG